MSKDRAKALKRLKQRLSKSQLEDVKLVILTAEVQGGYYFDGDSSVWSDDVNDTLMQLAAEFDPTTPKECQ